jgi:hypothetical protein
MEGGKKAQHHLIFCRLREAHASTSWNVSNANCGHQLENGQRTPLTSQACLNDWSKPPPVESCFVLNHGTFEGLSESLEGNEVVLD